MAVKQHLLMVLQRGEVVADEVDTDPLAFLDTQQPLQRVW